MRVTFKTIKNDLPDIPEMLREAVADELNEAAMSIVTRAKQLAPVDSGNMRNMIQQTGEATESELRSEVTASADYSAYVEYGTVKMAAQPFMTPAVEHAGQVLKQRLSNILK